MEKESIDKDISRIINIIKYHRKEKGISHEIISENLEMSTSAYNKLEHQETKLTLERFLRIQRFLQISITEFFELDAKYIYNQEFNDNSISTQQIKNLYQDNKELTSSYIDTLKEEITYLRNIVSELTTK